MFGPQLLRGIWDSGTASAGGNSPSAGWRGMPAVAVADDQLSCIGMPSYAQFAEKVRHQGHNRKKCIFFTFIRILGIHFFG